MSTKVTRRSRTFLHELDLVRVVTALSVVAVHVTAFTVVFNTTQVGAEIQNAAVSALHFTREVFLSLTALVMVHNYSKRPLKLKTFWRKRGLGVVVPYVVWSLFYVYFNVPHTDLGYWLHTAVADILTGNASYQLYYILLTIEFYIALPLLLWFVTKYRAYPWRVLGISAAIQLVLMYFDFNYVAAGSFSTTHLGQWLNDYQWRMLPEYQFYVLIGAFAALYLDELKAFVMRHGWLVVGGLAVGLGALWGRYAIALHVQHATMGYATHVFQPVMVVYAFTSILFLYWAGCVWASHLTAEGTPYGRRFVHLLSDSSFGIYLIHAFVLNDVLQYVAPHLLVGWPVAIRVFSVWFTVAAITSAICAILLYTPGFSRLIGRPALLPADFGPWYWARTRALGLFSSPSRRTEQHRHAQNSWQPVEEAAQVED